MASCFVEIEQRAGGDTFTRLKTRTSKSRERWASGAKRFQAENLKRASNWLAQLARALHVHRSIAARHAPFMGRPAIGICFIQLAPFARSEMSGKGEGKLPDPASTVGRAPNAAPWAIKCRPTA
jgi:hypothetical protein